MEIEKTIKQFKSREKQIEMQKMNVQNLDEKLKERENNLKHLRKGRPIMAKTVI